MLSFGFSISLMRVGENKTEGRASGCPERFWETLH